MMSFNIKEVLKAINDNYMTVNYNDNDNNCEKNSNYPEKSIKELNYQLKGILR